MTTIVLALFNVDAVTSRLSETIVRSDNRVVGDAGLLMNHINNMLCIAGEEGSPYFKLDSKEIASSIGITVRQVDNAKARLSKAGVLIALPPFETAGGWANLWRIQVFPSDTLGIIVEVTSPRSPNRIVKKLQDLPMNYNKGFDRYLGTNFTNSEFSEHYSHAEGYWDLENFESKAHLQATKKIVDTEVQEILKKADLSGYRKEWEERNTPADTTQLDSMMKDW